MRCKVLLHYWIAVGLTSNWSGGGNSSPFFPMMTVGDLKTFFSSGTVNQALRSSGSATMGQVIQMVVSDMVGKADFWWNQAQDTFDTVSGTAQYFLSNRVFLDKIWGMVDEDNDLPLTKVDLSRIYSYDPTPTETGNQNVWAYVDEASCQAVPTAAGVMTVSSSSVSDTSINFVLKGKVSGIERYETGTLNGTTTVTGALSWDSGEPVAINLNSKAAGLVTFTRGVTMAEIPPGHLRVLRPRIRLGQLVPGTTGDTIRYFFYKRALPLVSDADLVDLPDIAFRALRYGIEEIVFFLVGKTSASEAAFKKYEMAMNELINVSDRDIAGNELKMLQKNIPFAYRLPETITYTVV